MKGNGVNRSLRYWLGRKLTNAGARLSPPPPPIKSPSIVFNLPSSHDVQEVSAAIIRHMAKGGYGSA